VIELIHPELSNVSKTDIKTKLAQTLKTKDENISIFGLKTKFGGGRSTGFALIYDSLDARKKFDSKKMLRRVSFLPKGSFFGPKIAIIAISVAFGHQLNLSLYKMEPLTLWYYIGRLHREGQERQKAEKGNQGQSQEGQRYCQG
jgi:ribosomal protein S24E